MLQVLHTLAYENNILLQGQCFSSFNFNYNFLNNQIFSLIIPNYPQTSEMKHECFRIGTDYSWHMAWMVNKQIMSDKPRVVYCEKDSCSICSLMFDTSCINNNYIKSLPLPKTKGTTVWSIETHKINKSW